MLPDEAMGDLGGPPRLARWMEARKAQRDRIAALANAGVHDAAAYVMRGGLSRPQSAVWQQREGRSEIQQIPQLL